MIVTMRPKVDPVTYRRQQPKKSVAWYFGLRTGRTLKTAASRISRLQTECVELIRAYRDADEYERLHAWLIPIKAELAAQDIPDNAAADEIGWAYVEADIKEDLIRTTYRRYPSKENWLALRTILKVVRYLMLVFIRVEDARWADK